MFLSGQRTHAKELNKEWWTFPQVQSKDSWQTQISMNIPRHDSSWGEPMLSADCGKVILQWHPRRDQYLLVQLTDETAPTLFTVLVSWVTDVTQGEQRSQDRPTAAGLLSQKQFYVPSRWPLEPGSDNHARDGKCPFNVFQPSAVRSHDSLGSLIYRLIALFL